MARAKRTDRAEARRRYRAALAARRAGAATEETAPSAAARPPREERPPAATATPSGLPGIVTAFKLAAAPADVRGDLAYLPTLATGTKAIWLPSLVLAAIAAVFMLPGAHTNTLVILVFQTFLVPPPMAGPFLAGLLAPRASWLAGGIVGVVSALFFAGAIFAVPDTGSTVQQRADVALYGLLASPSFGILVGAFGGFYRRFLRLTSPNRARRPGRSAGRRASTRPR